MQYYQDEVGQYFDETGRPVTAQEVAGAMAAEDVGPLKAGAIAAGEQFHRIGQTLGLAELSAPEYMEQLEQEQPVATTVGGLAPHMVPVPGGPLVQLGYGALTGGLTEPESPVTGAALGAAGALAGEVAGRSLQRIFRGRPTPKALTREGEQFQAMGGRLMPHQEDVSPLSRAAGDFKHRYQAAMDRQPLIGTRLQNIKQFNTKRQNQLAARAIGEDADQLTPEVLDRAANRIGDVFEAAEKNIGTVKMSEDFVATVRESMPGRVNRFLADDGTIDGAGLGFIRSRARRLLALPEYHDDMKFILDEYMDVLHQAGGPSLGEASQQYKALLAIESGQAIDAAGDVNPRSMWSSLKRKYGRRGRVGGAAGDLYEFSRLAASKDFLDAVGNSGTAQRSVNYFNPITWGTGAAGYLGSIPSAGLLGPAGAAAGRTAAQDLEAEY